MLGQTRSKPSTLRAEVARLADMACTLDDLKNRLPDGEQRERLRSVVDAMHSVADQIDRLNSFGIYARWAA